jgi:succinate dehydrogenase/fumarate reductase flavoprotein subunit
MEFPMFLPGTFPWPQAVKGVNTPFKLSAAGLVHGHLLNKHGERFMARWDPVKMERTTRDILSVGIWTEIMEGRGGPHGGVFVSLRHLPENLIDYIMEWLPPKYLKRYGGFDMKNFIPDLKRFAMESVPACHFFNGGIRIDADCHTNLPGLYAAGEVTAGVHGSNRLSGNAFTDMIVWGHRAAASIARDVGGGLPAAEPDSRQVKELHGRILAPLDRQKGEDVQRLRDELMELAWQKAGIVRQKQQLMEAEARLRELREGARRVALNCRERIYNKEWIKALELENMLDNLECIVESALSREESRGSHYRKDFPQTDHGSWAVNQVLVKSGGGLQIRKERPVVTRMELPTDVHRYGT